MGESYRLSSEERSWVLLSFGFLGSRWAARCGRHWQIFRAPARGHFSEIRQGYRISRRQASHCRFTQVSLYDEADRLAHVCAGPSGATCAQNRHFIYDGRGFLSSEQHPEIGPAGGGIANYTYDPSGNVLTKDITGTSDFALRYAYEPANRLITVGEVDGETTRPIKSFHYARGNDGTDLRAGKLVLSKRTNWVDIVGPLATEVSGTLPVVISQAYRYEGLDGRVSQHQTRYQFSGGNYAFETGFTYDEQGNVSQLEYPRCLHYPCAGLDPPRTVDFGHTRGFLSSVEDFATSLTYQQGGMLHEVSHANGVVETVAVDAAHPFERPYRITTTSGWDSEVYQYDGSGNVKQIGEQLYLYDRMSRLVNGQVEVGGETKSQTVSYDNYGNILALTTDGSTLATPVTTATNRLSGATYDAGGNLTDVTLSGEHYVYTYDPLNMMKHLQSTTDQARVFLYDADDERVMTFDCAFVQCATQTGRLTTTIRGLDGKVLRVYNFNFGQPWDWVRDYVYRDGLLLASVEPDGGGGETTSHFHLDHLGSPRQITDGSAVETAFHTYYPFGGEATDPGQDEVQLKFTGHERDENGTSDAGKVDYMHARYCSVDLGRFLSPDPANAADRRSPQTWNRFGYASRNPLKRIDPDGLVDEAVWVVQAADPIPVAQAAAAASLARELKIEAGLAVLGGTPNTVRKLSRVLKGLRASRQIKPNRVRYLVGRHADMPSPRPSGFQSHHGVNSVWMEANYSRYRPSEAPAILMPNVPDHNATRGVFNRWRAEIARRQGRRIRDVDWTQVSPGEAWNLAEEQLRSTHVPDDVIEEYYRQFTIYLEHLGGLQ
ncbi:MAG: hypothetical protein GY722_06400 [bacterium]|nr:hypothetical protein [bacterium]